jgi:hypothetical protein
MRSKMDSDRKLVLNAAGKPTALCDLAEEKNLVAEPGRAERVRQMEKQCRQTRGSQRVAATPDAAGR